MVVGPLLMLSAAVGALAAGLPIWMLPAPLVAASGLAMFHDSRALRDYALFVVGALATGAWFMWHHFAFLEIAVGGLSLRALCVLVLAAMVPATVLPGLQHAGEAPAGCLCVCCCCCCITCLWTLRRRHSPACPFVPPPRRSPPTSAAEANKQAVGALLLVQAGLLCVLEELLYAGE